MIRRNSKGFTLIELLIVITIIGILAVAFLPSLLGAPSKARDTQRKADVQKIAGVLTPKIITNDLPDTGCVQESMAKGGTAAAFTLNKADFGGKIPADPLAGNKVGENNACDQKYFYKKGPSGYAFGVYAHMENKENANTKCSDAYAGTLTDTANIPATESEANGYWCYAVLVQ